MILLAVAAPTPGSSSSSFWLALLISILALAVAALSCDLSDWILAFPEAARLLVRNRTAIQSENTLAFLMNPPFQGGLLGKPYFSTAALTCFSNSCNLARS